MDQHKYVERLIKESKRVLIVSPYIDEYYAKFILRHARGKKIYIISSSPEKGAARLLQKGSFPSLSLVLAVLLLISYFTLAAVGKNFEPILLASLFFLTVFAIRLFGRKPRNIKLKIPKDFVHSKFYVGDASAIVGSANLTYRGMHKNIEHIEVIENLEHVKKLESEFWRLWGAE
ncbi:MAG: phospholipase D-like domain-containing protein [Candidatus Micrarchaeia archaeon]|jgi:phosphatidylserine/phosphatidylglycerophosphate/cardiolipin synthase-like enzyme